MLDLVNKTISKLFGSKSTKDLKELAPKVSVINAEYDKLSGLSNNELRAKTDEFKSRINEYLQECKSEQDQLLSEVEENPDLELNEKEKYYERIDKLKEDEDDLLEEILKELQPEVFAVVKETARRFAEESPITVTASELDKNIAATRDSVVVKGDEAVYQKTWTAAGGEVEWNMIHYDVQLIGGDVLHQGKIAEMATGEGKTLVATLPVYLNALAGKGVHLVTVNDYLARRDMEWNGPIFEFLGLTVDCIDKHQPNSPERRQAYLADITYGTNNEFGFDYLRDNMARNPEDMVQRKHHYAIVDEVDSVLIDDARTPLIISGPTAGGDDQQFQELKPKVQQLVQAQKNYVTTVLADAKAKFKANDEKGAGMPLLRAFRGLPKNKAIIKFLGETGVRTLLQKTENFYLQDHAKEMPKVDEELFFVIDEKNNSVELTEKGIDLITTANEDKNFFIMPDIGAVIADLEHAGLEPDEMLVKKDELIRDYGVKSERIHTMNQLLKAYTLFENDVEYILADDKVKIVDEQTGRVMEGRRYSDGLHQAIEAKENVKVEAATQTYATVTLQNYFRMYHKLSGMTGTAETEAGELWEIYKLDVVVIPTNKPIIRDDREDLVYKTGREKYNAVIDEVVELTEQKRPVLVGTTSVEISELLSRMLKIRKINHQVLNAKLHAREADIVTSAGLPGNVTIATNMAGRGTDIKLSQEVLDAGGLAIVGTERHESRRVDRQLRGRAGRQGDPGSSQFFVSLEDNLMRLFGSERIAKLMDSMGQKEGESIQHSMITKSIERAQRKVEENNFGTRKKLLEYDDVMNAQREVIYKKRRHALYGERLSLDLLNMKYDVGESLVNEHLEAADFENYKIDLLRYLAIESKMDEKEFLKSDINETIVAVFNEANRHYKEKSDVIAKNAFPIIKDVFENQGKTIENIVVPFSDGHKQVQVIANLRKCFDSEGKELTKAFERTITLAMIDDAWKEHLREMDDLKTSVQNAVYEQKDPLLIYKFESFELFKTMMDQVNKDIISFLTKAFIPVQDPSKVQQAKGRERTDMSKTQMNDRSVVPSAAEGQMQGQQQQQKKQKAQPVRADKKVGRNEPCPCGSGKKYKNCHGAAVRA
ncbi:MAG: preprotein translocase subunit SecA [Bacteroidia bacterium]|nr:preprotein translocase subunit SecA [Bacteroidia bacterium]